MKILITICARGGSKGIPGKNIRNLNGLSLITYSIKHAFDFASIFETKIAISTDSKEILKEASKLGIETNYIRPSILASDTAGKIDTIRHLLEYEESLCQEKYDYILDLDVSSPLRNVKDLIEAFNILTNDIEALNIFSVNHANRSPYFNMVEVKDNGYFGLVKPGNFVSRQQVPNVYDLNASFYIYRRAFFESSSITVINNRSTIYIMPHICFDLDHEIDFQFMEYLMKNNLLGFSL